MGSGAVVVVVVVVAICGGCYKLTPIDNQTRKKYI